MNLGDRMKQYEYSSSIKIPNNTPYIIRVDGRAFHTLTRKLNKPFDDNFIEFMNHIAIEMCNEIQNCLLAYLQSDEISFLVYPHIFSSPWFDNKVQKITSITSSLASTIATRQSYEKVFLNDKRIVFDSRVFPVPSKDVNNYFVWRQQDWERNSLQMVCRANYSHKEMNGKNSSNMHEMLFQTGINWNDYPTYLKRGRCIVKCDEWEVQNEIPQFNKNPNYIECLLKEVDEYIK